MGTAEATRAKIVEAADDLFYRHGFEHTSFRDIADAVQLSRGNFYYHFRTKDEILQSVIEARLANTRAMLDRWEADEPAPADRIRRFIEILVVNRIPILRHGCPVGTLTNELAKLEHDCLPSAVGVFGLFRSWLRNQFVLLGHQVEADALAVHVLARSQGIATLASAFRDDELVDREVQRLCDWLRTYLEETSCS